jgi:hypothetical protein
MGNIIKDVVSVIPAGIGFVADKLGLDGGMKTSSSGQIDRLVADRKNAQSGTQPQIMKKGGKVSSASSRADGCASKGKTRGKMV